MITIELGVEDLADTRFGISPLGETVRSLWALADPSRHTLHLPWLRSVSGRLDARDLELLQALVGSARIPPDFRGSPSRALPDFLTPRPARFTVALQDEIAGVRATPSATVRHDLLATHAPDPVPSPLRPLDQPGTAEARNLLAVICDTLERYWQVAMAPVWPDLHRVLEADTTYRARQIATGGARLLFADIHPNVQWRDGTLTITEMVSQDTVRASGRGLLLMPSIFAIKPVPPLDPSEPPALTYPSRGIGTLWTPPPQPEPTALVDLLGRTRALLLQMLEEPLATVEIARRLKVTPSAVSQHLQTLYKSGLVTRSRDRRQVLYRRSLVGNQLTAASSSTTESSPRSPTNARRR